MALAFQDQCAARLQQKMATVAQSLWFGSVTSFTPISVFSSPIPNLKTNSSFKTLKVSSSSESSGTEIFETDPLKLASEKAKFSNDPFQTRQTDSLRFALEEINKGIEKSTESNNSPNLSNDSLQLKETDIFRGALGEIKGFSNSTDSNMDNRGKDKLSLSNDSLQLKQEASLRLALEEIKGLQNLTESNLQNTVPDIANLSNNSLQMKQTDSLRLALEEIEGSQNSKESNTLNAVPDTVNLSNNSLWLKQIDSNRQELAQNKGFEKSEKSDTETLVTKSGEMNEVPMAVKLALEKAREYRQKKAGAAGPVAENKEKQSIPLIHKPIKRRDDPKISSMDFVGLNFADKKPGRGLPAGLLPTLNPYTEENLPEVEIILGDQSKFENKANSSQLENVEKEKNFDIYEPAVSTWGVFPRPRNISKAYGGGKVINIGDVLETEEESANKEARAKQLVAAYRNRVTFKIDPALKLQCEKYLKEGDSMMDQGSLKQALPLYQKIMDKLPFETELHGLAALNWSICQDSLLKSTEARAMYEKLQSHPKAHINKKAKDFIFTFEAMEMMKVKRMDFSKPSNEYKSYFDAFVEDKSVIFPVVEKTEDEVNPRSQTFPYIILFLFSPILFTLFIVLQKGSKF